MLSLAEQPEKDNPLRTAEMTLEDDYGMIDGVINNGRRGEEVEKAAEAAAKSGPEKSPPSGSGWRTRNGSVRNASPLRRDAPAVRPRSMAIYEPEQEMAAGMVLLPGRDRQAEV